MHSPLFFFAVGVSAILWYQTGLVGVMFLTSFAKHPAKFMERICNIIAYRRPKGWFALIVGVGLILALLGPVMLLLAIWSRPRKKINAFQQAVYK